MTAIGVDRGGGRVVKSCAPTVPYVGNRRQLMAEKNLHMMLHKTEQELKRTQEGRQQYELAYHRSEAKYANLLKQQMAKLHQLPTESMSTLARMKPASTQTESKGTNPNTSRRTPKPSDLEEDCCLTTRSSTRFPDFRPVVKSSDKSGVCVPREVTCIDSERLTTGDSGVGSVEGSTCFTNVDEEQSLKLSSETSTISNSAKPQHADKVSTSEHRPTRTSNDKYQLGGAISPPGISRSLFDKITHQNMRLRQVLEDVLHNRGQTIESFLDGCEYEDTIKALRKTIQQQREEIKCLKEQMLADPESLAQKCQQLEADLHKRNAALVGRQALLETLHKEYEKLLRQQQQQQQQQLDAGRPTTDLQSQDQADANPQASSQSKLKENEDKLDESLRQNSQLTRQLEKEQKKVVEFEQQRKAFDTQREQNRRLEAKIAEMEDTFGLLQDQLKIFETDFNSERKEKEKEKKSRETEKQEAEIKISALQAQLKTLQLKYENPSDQKNMAKFQKQFSTPVDNWSQRNWSPQEGLVADCPGDVESYPVDSFYESCKSMNPEDKLHSVPTPRVDVKPHAELSCHKCLRAFKPGQRDALQRHQARCIDDD